MFAEERRQYIQIALRKNRRVDVAMLAAEMEMSLETIRRDLRELEADGLLKRTHGGAILAPAPDQEMEQPLLQRKSVNHDKKFRIAGRAASFVRDKDVVAIDNSSTAALLLHHIPRQYNITIVTNSISLVVDILSLADCNWTCVALGGVARAISNSTFGSPALTTLANFRPHKLFASCAGVDGSGTLTEGNLDDAEMKRALLRCSQVKFLLADDAKFGRLSAVNSAGINDFDYLVTNSTADPNRLGFLQDSRVRLLYDTDDPEEG